MADGMKSLGQFASQGGGIPAGHVWLFYVRVRKVVELHHPSTGLFRLAHRARTNQHPSSKQALHILYARESLLRGVQPKGRTALDLSRGSELQHALCLNSRVPDGSPM